MPIQKYGGAPFCHSNTALRDIRRHYERQVTGNNITLWTESDLRSQPLVYMCSVINFYQPNLWWKPRVPTNVIVICGGNKSVDRKKR